MKKILEPTIRRMVACVAIVVFFAATAFAAGEYQRTRDGKTLVWNSNPGAGEQAGWFGDRDSGGYATGAGTLTWYTSQGKISGRYFGNMLRGKFNGPVNLHLNGKTSHAAYTDGERVTRWAVGPAPSRPENNLAAVPFANRTVTTVNRKGPQVAAAKRESPTPAPAPAPPSETLKSQPPRIVRAQPVKDAEMPKTSKISTPTAPTQPPVSTSLAKDSEKPASEARRKSKPVMDSSLTALVGPPSSLRKIPTDTQLSEPEVINLANTEARAHGYNLDDFERPKADYSTATEKWTLFYEQKSAAGSPQVGKYFTATVEDKSGKVVVGRRGEDTP